MVQGTRKEKEESQFLHSYVTRSELKIRDGISPDSGVCLYVECEFVLGPVMYSEPQRQN